MTPATTSLSSPPTGASHRYRLYKYRSLSGKSREYTRSIVEGGMIYYASPASFNDPFDMQWTVDIRDSDLTPNGRPLKEEIRSYAETHLRQSTNKELAVLSLSAINDHPLMWSHYADMHRGIVLELTFESEEELYKVEYDQKRPKVPLGRLEKCDPMFHEAVIATVKTKAPFWDYEQEWRAIDFNGPDERPLPSGSLTGIIFGIRTSKHDRKIVQDWARSKWPAIEYYEAVMSSDEYALKILRLGD